MMSSREVAEVVGEGESLERKRERLKNVVQEPSAREIAARELMEVETQIAERDRSALTADAEGRLVAIKRAHGSLSDQLEQDVHKVLAAAKEFAVAWERMVRRYLQLGVLRGEYDALVDGFALAEAPLPPVAFLATRKELAAAQETVARVGAPDT